MYTKEAVHNGNCWLQLPAAQPRPCPSYSCQGSCRHATRATTAGAYSAGVYMAALQQAGHLAVYLRLPTCLSFSRPSSGRKAHGSCSHSLWFLPMGVSLQAGRPSTPSTVLPLAYDSAHATSFRFAAQGRARVQGFAVAGLPLTTWQRCARSCALASDEQLARLLEVLGFR
eukprot:GHRQ01021923.1.p1 GENE.GHRQ01021923.1~~GHRQ01021923.1.p1  ORF type:complete len:171 (+),score=2.18 GHRQ01021923.1:164-676(+)